MSKSDLLKMQTCVLKVNIHCDGCKHKVKKMLQKVDGVYSVSIDAEQGKVTVSGSIDPIILVKKLEKSGKQAEIWEFQKGANYNQVHLNNQFKNMQIQNNKGVKDNKSQKGGKDQRAILHQMKGTKDMELPHKDHKSVKFNLPEDEFDMSDDEFDDDFDNEFDDEFDDEYDDEEEEFGHGHGHGHGHGSHLPNKKMSVMGNGSNGQGLQGQGHYGKMMPNMGSNNHVSNGHNGMSSMHSSSEKKRNGNGKKSGDFELPIEIKGKDNCGKNEMKNGNGGKKGGGINKMGGNKKQGRKDKYGFKRGVSLFGRIFGKKTKEKISCMKGSDSVVAINNSSKGGKKGEKGGGKKNGDHDINKMNNSHHEVDVLNQSKGGKHSGSGGGKNMGGGHMGQMGNVKHMGQMGNNGKSEKVSQMGPINNYPMGPMVNYPMGSMGNMPAAQGLPAQSMMNGGYYQGMGHGNPYQQQQYYQGMGNGNSYNNQQQQYYQGMGNGNSYNNQQQYMAMMMNQQIGGGNDMFQPMMYARPQVPFNYATPPPMMGGEPYHHFFNDENANSCSIM